MEAEETYQVQLTDEIKASSPEAALRVFLSRLRDEETSACVEHLQSGEKYFIEFFVRNCPCAILHGGYISSMKATVKKARLDKSGTAKPLTSLMGYFSNPVYGGCLFPCSKNASRLVYVNEKGEEVEVIK